MKSRTRLALFFVVGVILTALLVWSAVPIVLVGTNQVFAFALFVAFYVTVFSLLLISINHRDPGSWRAYLVLSIISVPFILAAFILFDFRWFTPADVTFCLIVALETYILLWFIQPMLEKRFPKKTEREIVLRRRQEGEP